MKRTTDDTAADRQRPTADGQPLICVPVCVRRASELRATVARAVEVADVIELRLDCLADDAQLKAARSEIAALLHERTRPFIITLRPAEQGGQRRLTPTARSQFWRDHASYLDQGRQLYPDFIDRELSDYALWADEQAGDKYRLICSLHDFVGVPADLDVVYRQLSSTNADVLKLAVQANEITDCIPVLHLLERARSEGRKLIAIAMGAAGVLTRILAPARGAFLTYGALAPEQATAPGQLTAAELRNLYRIHTLDERTEVFGLAGRPVMHSLSPHMHNAAFAARGLNAVYIPFEVRELSAFVKRMVAPNTCELDWRVRGLSITAPHKQAIMTHLDVIESAAREIGAVNTLVVEGDKLHGYNTDALAALAPLQGVIELKGARVAIMGAGGAARALLWGLQGAGANVTVFARSVARAQTVVARFGAACRHIDDARFAAFDLVVNATPLGTRGHTEAETPATAAQLRGARVAYDLIYNPTETRFMREARAAGCAHVMGGLPMLVAQAAAQFELWTGQRAPLEAMQTAATKRLAMLG